jgi:hypothetical protein
VATAEVNSVATRRFWELFHSLPRDVQELAVKNYHIWQSNSRHPSLHFRRLQGSTDRFSIRIGDHYRALGRVTGDTITWVWIGTHSEYDRLVGSRL